MPRNNTPMIIGAVLFGLLAIGLTMFLLLPKPPAPAPPPQPQVANTAPQFVARGEIPPRTTLTSDMIREQTVDKKNIPANAITNRSQLTGLMSSVPIHNGEVLTNDMVSRPTIRVTPVFFQVPQGFRAVAIYVDMTATAAGLVDVGDRVDVIANLKVSIKTSANTTGTSVSARTIAQNLLVLGVDRSISAPPPTPTPAPLPAGAPTPVPPPPGPAPTPTPQKMRVFLAADNITAEHLTAANEAGNLHITIRNPKDATNAPLPEVFEYPTRIVETKAELKSVDKMSNAIKSLADANSGRTTVSRPRIPREVPNIASPYLAPAAPTGMNLPPAGPPTNEVTVIRGTEKTRVIVPADGASH